MFKTAFPIAFTFALAVAGCMLACSPVRAADEKPEKPATAVKSDTRFFELRTYTANPGKLPALLARFRNHTNALFEKHGITMIGYWVPTDEKLSQNTLIYILAFPSKEAQAKAWKDFVDDPTWKAAKAESEKEGVLVSKVESRFMAPTDFSPIK